MNFSFKIFNKTFHILKYLFHICNCKYYNYKGKQ